LRLNNLYRPKIPRDNLRGYIRRVIEVSPEEVIADARSAGLLVSSIDEFRSMTPEERAIIGRLMIIMLTRPPSGAPLAAQPLEWEER
jgi:hypothetical protein